MTHPAQVGDIVYYWVSFQHGLPRTAIVTCVYAADDTVDLFVFGYEEFRAHRARKACLYKDTHCWSPRPAAETNQPQNQKEAGE